MMKVGRDIWDLVSSVSKMKIRDTAPRREGLTAFKGTDALLLRDIRSAAVHFAIIGASAWYRRFGWDWYFGDG